MPFHTCMTNFKSAEEWREDGWVAVPLEKRLEHIRKIQSNTMREAARIVAKSYGVDDWDFSTARALLKATEEIEKGEYKPV